MFVLGGIGIVCGICMGAFAAVGPLDQIISKMQLPSAAELQMSPEKLLKIVLATMAILSLGQAILTIVLGVFVRRGAVVAIVISLVLCVLIVLMLMARTIGSLVQLAQRRRR